MNKYDDIINIKYQKSISHPHMSNHDRAAQFAPFAALTGYEELIKETARITKEKIILSNEQKLNISEKLIYLSSCQKLDLDIHIIYFVKDKNKSGGEYFEETTNNIKIDNYHKMIKFNGKNIKIDDIFDISF